jgi:hypothetical protein
MQPKPKPARYRPLFLLVALACVGLFAAIYHNKARRLEIEAAHPAPVELREVHTGRITNDLAAPLTMQGLSFRVDGPAAAEPGSGAAMSLAHAEERRNAGIVETIPATLLERARRDMTMDDLTNRPPLRPTGEKIVIE